MAGPVLPLQDVTVPKSTNSTKVTYLQSPVPECLEDRPWKYVGYRLFSRWMGSDKAFFTFRKFSTLHARVILGLQDDVSLLEEQLNLLEESYSQPDSEDIDNGSYRRDTYPERKLLLENIRLALEKYYTFLHKYCTISSRPAPSQHDINSINSWFTFNPQALAPEETSYLNHTDDLIALHPNIRSPLYHLLRHYMELTDFFPQIFRREPTDELAIDGATIWYDDGKFEKVAYGFICMVGLAMFIVPFWVLNSVGDTRVKLGVVTVFVVCFYGVVALGTTAKAFESLAAAAAYSAVLMVFLQVNSNVGKGA